MLISDEPIYRTKSAAPNRSDQQNKTHRSSAWGVLGSTTDGLPFLLTHPVVFRSHYPVKTRLSEKVSRPFVKLCKSLNSCNDATYSGIAGGRAAINSVNRASLRRPANSGSLYTLSIPLYPSSRALRRYCSDRSESPRLAQSFAIM